MEASPGRWLLIFSAVYFLSEICANAHRSFWFDEFFASYLADLPSFGSIWSLIGQGIELNPPLPFWIIWIVHHTVGRGEIMSRMPAVIGFWVMCLCLYHFVRRRTDTLHGFIGLLLPLFTYTAWNANEARGYGMLLGFSGLALLCWQTYADHVRRPIALVGLAVGIAGAVSCHYHAVYLAGALALGEAIRTADRKRVDVPVWVAFVLGVSPLAFYLPLIRTAQKALHTFWTPPLADFLYSSYADLLGPITIVLFLFLALLARSPDLDRVEWRPAAFPRHELAVALALFAMPLVLYLSTYVATMGFYTRYVQEVVIGAVIIAAVFVYRIGGSSRSFRELWVSLLVCFCFVPWAIWQVSKIVLMPPAGHRILYSLDLAKEPGWPVVVDSDNDFLASYHYASPEVRARLFMLADAPSAVRYNGGDTAMRSLELAQTFRDLHVVDYHKFISEHRVFLLARTKGASWITQKLLADGADLRLLELRKELGFFAEDRLLYRVTVAQPSETK